MNWEDFPLMSTQPIGVQGNGTVVKLYPPAIGTRTVTPPLNPPMWNLNQPPLDNSEQMITISASGGPNVTSIVGGAYSGDVVQDVTVLSPAGWWLVLNVTTFAMAFVNSDGTTTTAPMSGVIYPLTIT